MHRGLVTILTALAAAGCNGDDAPAPRANDLGSGYEHCELLKHWRPGEHVIYRFADASEEWLVAITIEELRAGFVKFTTREDQVRGGTVSSEGTTEVNWEECPSVLTPIASDRAKLVMGQHSPWGAVGANPDAEHLHGQSCEPATRKTPAGTFPVQRCDKPSLLGPAESIADDVHLGTGAAPGGGFVAREVHGSDGRASLALLEWWDGR